MWLKQRNDILKGRDAFKLLPLAHTCQDELRRLGKLALLNGSHQQSLLVWRQLELRRVLLQEFLVLFDFGRGNRDVRLLLVNDLGGFRLSLVLLFFKIIFTFLLIFCSVFVIFLDASACSI